MRPQHRHGQQFCMEVECVISYYTVKEIAQKRIEIIRSTGKFSMVITSIKFYVIYVKIKIPLELVTCE